MAIQAQSTHELISRWLESDPEHPGASNWRIKGHRLPVWRILRQIALEKGMDSPEEYWDMLLSLELTDPSVKSIANEIAGYYDIPAKAIQAAVAYAANHLDLMAARLKVAHDADAD